MWIGSYAYKVVLELHDLPECPPANAAIHPPGGECISLREDLLDLLERASSRLRKHEEDVDECGKVESTEDEIGLVGDISEARGDGPRKGKVEYPIRRRRQRDGLGPDTHWEDLCRIRPGNRAHGDSITRGP